ncbi:hypothetical protein MRB53_010320 [Persea americana]|uniref:Uncharacterized protein n=1 Tax=Persea americana TaxID=3435 RepID=A0ACC2LRN5_PERAE|nr:hypothetical protein MRB53_010320 [Persea americana]
MDEGFGFERSMLTSILTNVGSEEGARGRPDELFGLPEMVKVGGRGGGASEGAEGWLGNGGNGEVAGLNDGWEEGGNGVVAVIAEGAEEGVAGC